MRVHPYAPHPSDMLSTTLSALERLGKNHPRAFPGGTVRITEAEAGCGGVNPETKKNIMNIFVDVSPMCKTNELPNDAKIAKEAKQLLAPIVAGLKQAGVGQYEFQLYVNYQLPHQVAAGLVV